MYSYATVTAAALIFAGASPAIAQQVVSDAQCDCYLSDGRFPTYFKNHGFWDFRSLGQYAKVPPVIQTLDGNKNADFTSPVFNWDSDFAKFWGPQHWAKNEDTAFPMVNSFNNLYIEKNNNGDSDTFMTMRTSRLPAFQTAAEFESQSPLDHASIRMLAKTHGSSGACTSVFTYKGANQPRDVQECDIEMLTRDDAHYIHYTNQPGVLNGDIVPGASRNVTLPNGLQWSDWVKHRLDWTPGRTTWSANDAEVASQTFQAPRDPSIVLLNAWSDGGEWTDKMPEGGEAYQNVQWIEILYNVADKASCNKVCSVDKSPVVGKPVLL